MSDLVHQACFLPLLPGIVSIWACECSEIIPRLYQEELTRRFVCWRRHNLPLFRFIKVRCLFHIVSFLRVLLPTHNGEAAIRAFLCRAKVANANQATSVYQDRLDEPFRHKVIVNLYLKANAPLVKHRSMAQKTRPRRFNHKLTMTLC